jgi:hypothetical protein
MKMPHWVAVILVTALANCLANHIIGCAFQAVGLPCPRQN